ncbi:MAG: cytochrome c oxidase subunit II, partial [Leptolyngbya sp. ERB_1_2]
AIGAFILLGLVSMMLYSVLFYRAKPDDYSEGHPARGSVKIELLWLAVPTALVLWIEFQNINIYQQLNITGLDQIVHLHTPLSLAPAVAATPQEAPKPATQQIEVIAKQWTWTFLYPDGSTRSELHLPVNESTQLNLRAQDVIHGFYIPAFRLKQDIFPARNTALVVTPIRVGQYRLQDSSFSGTDFALMQADVYVESRQAYNDWLAAAPSITAPALSVQPLIRTGWNLYLPDQSVADRTSSQDEKS